MKTIPTSVNRFSFLSSSPALLHWLRLAMVKILVMVLDFTGYHFSLWSFRMLSAMDLFLREALSVSKIPSITNLLKGFHHKGIYWNDCFFFFNLLIWVTMIFLLRLYFYRAVLSLQRSGREGTEIAPTCAQPPPLPTPPTSHPEWCICFNHWTHNNTT